MTDSCETCWFWREPGCEEGTGECHRYAPRPVHEVEITANEAYARFPMTYAGDWCGEFEKKAVKMVPAHIDRH